MSYQEPLAYPTIYLFSAADASGILQAKYFSIQFHNIGLAVTNWQNESWKITWNWLLVNLRNFQNNLTSVKTCNDKIISERPVTFMLLV